MNDRRRFNEIASRKSFQHTRKESFIYQPDNLNFINPRAFN